MEYNKNNHMKTSGGTFGKLLAAIGLAMVFITTNGHVAYAQSYVPVRDADLISDFEQYTKDLFQKWDDTFGKGKADGTTETLRDLIAGKNPGGIAKDECIQGDNTEGDPIPAYAYGAGSADRTTWGPWKFAFESSTASGGSLLEGVPFGAKSGGPYVKINYSHSLRCLLMEVVEWQKLGLSVQIHSLLKTYISDAQQAQLTKQLKSKITAANLTFAKAGNQVNDNGVISNSPVFVTSYNQNLYNVNGRQLDALSTQAAADPVTAGPQGSLGICQPWRIDAAAGTIRNNRTKVDDAYKYTATFTKCQNANPANPDSPFASEAGFQNFSDNLNDPVSTKGGIFTFNHLLSNPQDTPIGSMRLLDMAASDRIAKQEQSTKAEAQNSGFIPTKRCSLDAADPNCLDDQFSIAINPGGQNEGNIRNLTEQMNNEVTANIVDAQSATSSELAPTDININTGLVGANTLPLETSETAVNQLIQEFYDTINFGYFGIHKNTTQWAQGTMLMIYDEMKFSQDLSNGQGGTIVTNGTAAVPSGY